MKEVLFSNDQFTLFNETDRKGSSRRLMYEVRAKYIKEDILKSLVMQAGTYSKTGFDWLEMPAIESTGNDVIYINCFKTDKNLENNLKKRGKIKTEAALELVVDAAEKIFLLSETGLFNRIIKPENIIPDEKGVTIIFSLLNTASDIRYGKNQIPETEFIINELKYTAPELLIYGEQSSDISSNIYSLGIILYEILTGITPFQSDEPDELVYSHQYRQPVPPMSLNQSIPPEVSEIIMKMIAKSRDDRYLTIPGLIHDLKISLENIQKHEQGVNFILGQYDIPEVLRLPAKLYGREEADSVIKSSLESARRGSKQVLFIAGASGIGKTALIERTIKPIAGDTVYFLSGKCEAIKRNIPYSPLVKAFNHIIDLILLEPYEIQQIWRDSIVYTIGDNGGIIVDMIPRFKELIGEPPPMQALESDENKNRMNIILSRLIKVFAPPKQILIIFIDDAQWIDSASLSLVKYLVSSGDVESLLFICSYRDNEITEFHNLKIFREEIRGTVANEQEVILKPLDISNINRIISDTIRISDHRVRELSELTLRFTEGNPLYIREFLGNIYKRGILKHSHGKGWIWDNSQILRIYETDSVIRTMINRMNEHKPVAIEILKYTSCIGNTFSTGLLSEVMEVPAEFIDEEIKSLIRDGYYRQRSSDYVFVHDKIIEGALSLLTESEICRIHYRIGQVLMNRRIAEGNDNYLFDIINHLTFAKTMLDNEEKSTLAFLKSKAGEKAKKSYAYEAALKCFYGASELIQEEGVIRGEEMHEYLIKVYTECFICEYMMDNMERSYELFSMLNRMAKTRGERVRIYTINCMLLFNFSKPEMAIEMGIKGLSLIDIKISKRPGLVPILRELAAFRMKMLRRDPESILEMKKLNSDEILAAMELLFELWMPAYAYSHSLMKLLTLKMANITLDHGLCHISPFAFMALGIIYGTGRGKFRYGYNLGMLSLRLNEIEKNAKMECILNYYFASFQSSWINHYSKSMPFFNKANEIGLKNGLIYYTALNRVFFVATRLIQGENLHEVSKLCDEYLRDIKMNNDNPWFATKAISSIKRNIELMTDYDSLQNTRLAERGFITELKEGEVRQPLHWFYLFRAKVNMQLGDFDEALQDIHSADRVVNWHFASTVIFEHLYIKTISILNSTMKKSFIRRLKEWFIIKGNMMFIKRCAKSAPENFNHKYLLLKAELLKRSIFRYKALLFYNRAIDFSKRNSFNNDAALAYELASKFYRESGAEELYRNSIRCAYECYKLWGAHTKVKRLEYEHSFLISDDAGRKGSASVGMESSILTDIIDDLMSISYEQEMNVVIEKISNIVYSGGIADRICFLVADKEQIMITSEMSDGFFTFHGEPQKFTMVDKIGDIFNHRNRDYKKGVNFINSMIDSGVSGNVSIAVIPFEQRGRVHFALYLEKKKDNFSEDEKRSIYTIAAFSSPLFENVPERKRASSDVRKDNNTFNNVIMSRLMHKINTEKVYLTEELTLPMLAKEIGITPPQLSEFINNYFDMNFNSFINKYRIEEAKKIILENSDKTILNIAFEVGFNSLSVFYKAFIKFEDITPAAFRKLNDKGDAKGYRRD